MMEDLICVFGRNQSVVFLVQTKLHRFFDSNMWLRYIIISNYEENFYLRKYNKL